MSQTYRNPGHTIEYTNGTGSAIANGEVVELPGCIGIATNDIPDGEDGLLSVDGVHTLPSLAEDIPNGTKVYVSPSGKMTTDDNSGANMFAGTVVGADFVSADADVDVKINWPG